jgi:hypothetical protein
VRGDIRFTTGMTPELKAPSAARLLAASGVNYLHLNSIGRAIWIKSGPALHAFRMWAVRCCRRSIWRPVCSPDPEEMAFRREELKATRCAGKAVEVQSVLPAKIV